MTLVFQRTVQGSTTYRTMRQLRSNVKIDNFMFRNLRHCAVTHLADVGMDTETSKAFVGPKHLQCSSVLSADPSYGQMLPGLR